MPPNITAGAINRSTTISDHTEPRPKSANNDSNAISAAKHASTAACINSNRPASRAAKYPPKMENKKP